MEKSEILQRFESDYEQIKDIVINAAMGDERPTERVAGPMERMVSLAAEAGSKKAAVLYGAVAAYDNNNGIFDKEKAVKLLFDNNAVKAYQFFLEEELWDYEYYSEMRSFPLTYFCEEIIRKNMKKSEILQDFESKYEQIKDMVINAAMTSQKPTERVAGPMERMLSLAAEAGSSNAAVLYGAVAAYDNNNGVFSKEKAVKMLLDNNAVEDYPFFLEKEFGNIWDYEFYSEMRSFPFT